MVMWERPAGPAGGNGGCAGQVMDDGRHEPKGYILGGNDPMAPLAVTVAIP